MRQARIMWSIVVVAGLAMFVAVAASRGLQTSAAAAAPKVLVGPGYTDVSPKHLVRTSSDRLYGLDPVRRTPHTLGVLSPATTQEVPNR